MFKLFMQIFHFSITVISNVKSEIDHNRDGGKFENWTLKELFAVVNNVDECAFIFVFDGLFHLLNFSSKLLINQKLLNRICAWIFTRICYINTAENGKCFLKSTA